jgi:hypothetical protein
VQRHTLTPQTINAMSVVSLTPSGQLQQSTPLKKTPPGSQSRRWGARWTPKPVDLHSTPCWGAWRRPTKAPQSSIPPAAAGAHSTHAYCRAHCAWPMLQGLQVTPPGRHTGGWVPGADKDDQSHSTHPHERLPWCCSPKAPQCSVPPAAAAATHTGWCACDPKQPLQ